MWLELAFLSRLLLLTSVAALLLSLAGIYAMLSFTVSRRTREIGIRIALGAEPGRVLGAVFRRAFVQVGTGIAVGGLLVGALTYGATGLSAVQVALIGGYLFVMVGVCLAACVVPVRRAFAIEPTEALRAE